MDLIKKHPSCIFLKGCRQHNLKNISLSLPKNAMIVFTGVSGSGKSSLAFDTIFAEGQRRYLEYISSQSRTWVKQMARPDVDLIEGLSPTLAVGQGRHNLFARGTIATYTDIYDFLALLYANIGEQYSPFTGKRLLRHSRQEMIHLILTEYAPGTRFQLISPIPLLKETPTQAIARLQQMGFIRLKIDGEDWTNDLPLPSLESIKQLEVVVDRLEMKEGIRERLATSIDTALDVSHGVLKIQEGKEGPYRFFTEIYVCPETSFSFAPLRPQDFNFNSPHGACPTCGGLGGQKEVEDSLGELPAIQWKICSTCHGARLKAESLACRIQGENIDQLCQYTVSELMKRLDAWNFSGSEAAIAKEILPAIQSRLHFLQQVGLGYLSLNRPGKTLSDGEAQRIQLASQIGAKLSGLIYVLDEPSLGLHRHDIVYLQQAIEELKQLGNTIVMVEHERTLIREADVIIELGPGAGKHGGNITFQGNYHEMLADTNSLTGQWLSGRKKYGKTPRRKPLHGWLEIKQASLHNLVNFSVRIPLQCLVGVCGVSGSGKSTLMVDIVGESIRHSIRHGSSAPFLKGYESFKRIVMGLKSTERFSARSIPATYVGLMTPLRQLFAETRLAKARGYTASRFSLNKKGGRCEACEGLGEVQVHMQLMPDLFIPCDVCQGIRYNYETLQVTWESKSIAEVLAMSIDEAALFFRYIPTLEPALSLMHELGLGYLTLGQSFHSLSGGEIQRLKLVADLAGKMQERTLYILDEPSAGLHFEDIKKLLGILHRLVDNGHSVMIIEHHLDLLQQADWLIELGPEAGPAGGHLIFEGTPAELIKKSTPTALALKNIRTETSI